MSDNTRTEIVYRSNEVADLLKVASSTLRKWCAALEAQGYEFTRGSNNSRLYSDRDVVTLRRLRELIQVRKMALESAANAVLSILDEEERARSATEESAIFGSATDAIVVNEQSDKLDEILKRLDQQESFNQELLRRLDKQQQYIEKQDRYISDRLEARDEQLMTALREVQETKKLTAVAQDEAKKKGFFARLFNKS
ncbi:DUF3967 domain-containing protein [Metabacillus fastidiosus]|uniref:DUF3967 domain-containing protein n=1 Tax=Metabacillus fastidiosus TaxID=1458 RepID=UPI003D2A0B6A